LQDLDLEVSIQAREHIFTALPAYLLCKRLAFPVRCGDNRRFSRAALMHCKVHRKV